MNQESSGNLTCKVYQKNTYMNQETSSRRPNKSSTCPQDSESHRGDRGQGENTHMSTIQSVQTNADGQRIEAFWFTGLCTSAA